MNRIMENKTRYGELWIMKQGKLIYGKGNKLNRINETKQGKENY